ncbi:hypothetical protein [Streptomyces endophytica]|uniref:Uncharacterized protein n=1 Tax=Streptomyces endophytica TaxID=2991496 RepID=A0ABY6PGX0_9ACTN|nr:hypothetical protein [Streptomyces endophytica]UZJ33129.1 hypothetical protein OJ254_26185 [Streptomyces endophytica]
MLVTAVASAAAHGYAHAIAHRTADAAPVTTSAVRSMLAEWPLVVATLPTVAALFGSYLEWWGEEGAIDVALTFNTAALFGWGVWGPGRRGGAGRRRAGSGAWTRCSGCSSSPRTC